MDWTKPLPTRRLWVLNGPLPSERSSQWRILKQNAADVHSQTTILVVFAVESASTGACRTMIHAETRERTTVRHRTGTAKPIGHALETGNAS